MSLESRVCCSSKKCMNERTNQYGMLSHEQTTKIHVTNLFRDAWKLTVSLSFFLSIKKVVGPAAFFLVVALRIFLLHFVCVGTCVCVYVAYLKTKRLGIHKYCQRTSMDTGPLRPHTQKHQIFKNFKKYTLFFLLFVEILKPLMGIPTAIFNPLFSSFW